MLDQRQRLDWLQLIRTQNIGPVTFHRLIAKYKTAASALAALPELSRKAGRARPLKAADDILQPRKKKPSPPTCGALPRKGWN